MSVLEEIEDWKLEAKFEDSSRYFFHTKVVDRIQSGKKSYVVGRKGSGKTAISEYLAGKDDSKSGYFARKLTFKNFPFNKLYELADNGYTAPNQYITIWKYVIYSTTCKLLASNENVDVETRMKLQKMFDVDVTSALSSGINRWSGYKIDFKVLGNGVGFGQDREMVADDLPLSSKVEILEKFLIKTLGAETYVVIFDELDENYKDVIEPEKYKQYTALLTSLFKAVQDVRGVFSRWKYYPVIFLRDDIYDLLQDPDKTKWSDLKVELDWDDELIKKMLAFRISRSIDPKGDSLPFGSAWEKVFEGGKVKYGDKSRKEMPIFDYIKRSTQGRPRDFVRYIQVCAGKAVEREKNKISSRLVSQQDKSFSNYLRSELEDEIHGVIPEIKSVLNIFTKMRKQTLPIRDFKDAYEDEVKAGKIPDRGYQFVLEVLFLFSVIGNQPKQRNKQVFKYLNKEARLNMNESIVVHRGLFKSLQIM